MIEPILGGNAVFLAIAAFIILCIFLGVRIVPQSEKHVVERFGRLRAVLGPGINFVVPFQARRISGVEAAQSGFATRSYPADELEDQVLEKAKRIAMIPTDIVQINKRTVHRGMAVMGFPTAIRQGTELCALTMGTETFQAFIAEKDSEGGLTGALSKRDAKFGDYRTSEA